MLNPLRPLRLDEHSAMFVHILLGQECEGKREDLCSTEHKHTVERPGFLLPITNAQDWFSGFSDFILND